MSERFKDYTINETHKIVDESYINWITTKNNYDNTHLEPLSTVICMAFKADIKYSNYKEKQEYWFQKFKDEEIIINKFKQEIVSWYD